MKKRDMWWLLLLRGLALLAFGIVAIFWPGLTLVLLALIFGINVLISGVVNLVKAIGEIGHSSFWFLTLVLGIIEIGAGIFLITNPLITLAFFILLVGFVLIVQGIFEIIMVFAHGESSSTRLWLIIVGVLSLVVGFLVLRNPIAGGVGFSWILGIYALFAGTVLTALSFKLKGGKGKK